MNADQEHHLIRVGAANGFALFGDTLAERFLLRRGLIRLVTPAAIFLEGRSCCRLTDVGRIRLAGVLVRRMTRRIESLAAIGKVAGDIQGQAGTGPQLSEDKEETR